MLPDLDDLLDRTRIVTLPLHTRFRGVTERQAAIIEGTESWTEFSPFLEYDDEEASHWLAGAIEYGFDPQLVRLDGGTVEVNATVPAVSPEEVPAVLARFDGCKTIKIKVAEAGQSLGDDVARIHAVDDLAPNAAIRIDANGGWVLEEAEAAIRAITRSGIDLQYVEQPVRSVEELAELRRRLGDLDLKIAADESIRKATDPIEVARLGAADHVIVKAQPLGGVRRAAQVVQDSELTATVSSALDTSVGIVMGAQLAARLPEPRFAAGLGTVSLFAADVTREPRRPVQGTISLDPVVPDDALMREYATTGQQADWWIERIRNCYAILKTQEG